MIVPLDLPTAGPCKCGHIKTSHDQVVVIKDQTYETACKSCTCLKYFSKQLDDALKEQSHSSNGKTNKEKDDRRTFPLMKYTSGGHLYEAVQLAGLPHFVRYKDGKIEAFEEIEEASRIILPFVEEEPAPYSFADIDDLNEYIRLAEKESYYSLYQWAFRLSEKYNDIPKSHRVVYSADQIFSYFQDKIGMTHYLFLYGLPGTGKGAMLELAHQIAYRAVLFASAKAASIYRTLGTVEPGQATLLIDEANKLDENDDLREVLKTGYKLNGKVPRVLDASSSSHTAPTYFCTFGLKMIAAERLPNEYNAGGFLSRTFRLKSYYGKPQQKIDKVVGQHEKNKKLRPLFDELVKLRKTLFAFRLIHHNDEIADVKLNIDGRPEELCLPLIQIFKDTPAEEEILTALSEFVIEAQNEKADGFDAYLYERMKEMLDAANTLEFENSTIWNMLKELLRGEDVPDKPQMMRTVQFGDISKTRVTKTLEKFGAKRDRDSTGDKRILRFDRERFDKFCAMFDVPKKIEISKLSDTSDMPDTFRTPDSPESDGQDSLFHAQDGPIDSPENTPAPPQEVSEASEVSDMVKCPYCPAKYSSRELVIKHSANVHPGRPVTDDLDKQEGQLT